MGHTREGWDTALDYQTELIRQAATKEGRQYLDGFAESMARNGAVVTPTGTRKSDDEGRGYQLVNAAVYMLTTCDPMYVTPDICDLINHAAESFRPEPLIETDLITPAGFVYFGKPLLQRDTHGRMMNHRAMEWCITEHRHEDGTPANRGVLIAFYAHRDDPDPYWDEQGQKMPKIGGCDLTLAHITSFQFGDPTAARAEDVSVRDSITHTKVFFRLCQQQIVVARHERAARPVWKRAATWKQIKEVVVFTLRRAKGARYEGPEREVEWTHRWMVGAHWRNQWYPSEKVHRQIWIAPYVKGPEGAPLVLKRRAFELVR